MALHDQGWNDEVASGEALAHLAASWDLGAERLTTSLHSEIESAKTFDVNEEALIEAVHEARTDRVGMLFPEKIADVRVRIVGEDCALEMHDDVSEGTPTSSSCRILLAVACHLGWGVALAVVSTALPHAALPNGMHRAVEQLS